MADGKNLPAIFYLIFNSPAGSFNRSVPVENDGTFTAEAMPAGSYDVRVAGPRTPFSIVEMAANGAVFTELHLLKLGSNSVNLAIIVARNSATLNGYVQQSGKPAPGIMIVLVPNNRSANHELFRREESNSDGSFSLGRVAPGAYTLIAIDDGWALDWARPEVIARYLAHGMQISIAPSQKVVNLQEPVEVQPR
jgi:hypothetical protein